MTTTPSFHDLPPLRTDADVLARVEHIVGTAAVPRRLWLFLVDGDGRQAPTVVPVDGVPRRPSREEVDGLGSVVDHIAPMLATTAGPASVFFALERTGSAEPTGDDRAWADDLTAMCRRAGTFQLGVHLVTERGVARL